MAQCREERVRRCESRKRRKRTPWPQSGREWTGPAFSGTAPSTTTDPVARRRIGLVGSGRTQPRHRCVEPRPCSPPRTAPPGSRSTTFDNTSPSHTGLAVNRTAKSPVLRGEPAVPRGVQGVYCENMDPYLTPSAASRKRFHGAGRTEGPWATSHRRRNSATRSRRTPPGPRARPRRSPSKTATARRRRFRERARGSAPLLDE